MQNKANTFFYFYQIPCMSKWANNGTNQGLYLGAGFCLWFYYFCYLQNPNVHHYFFANGNQPTTSLTQKLVQQLSIKVINETSRNKEYNLHSSVPLHKPLVLIRFWTKSPKMSHRLQLALPSLLKRKLEGFFRMLQKLFGKYADELFIFPHRK